MSSNPLLQFEAVTKHFPGGVVGLQAIDLNVIEGEFLSLLGPSGCGKTTCLRVTAGFESPTTGHVVLEGHRITKTRPFERPINTVFQDYALFPNMSVAENVEFGLSLKKVTRPERRRQAGEALELVGLADKIDARVQQLSGGQRQRVALARAIVCRPRILLLDEPLSALDAHLREQMQIELTRLQTALGMTFVMVTHDQTEAMSISNRIVVMNQGRIEQVASPSMLYDNPATNFVANFIGTMNTVAGERIETTEESLRYKVGTLRLQVTRPAAESGDRSKLTNCKVGIRPENLAVSADPTDSSISAVVTAVAFHGSRLRLHLRSSDAINLIVDASRQELPEIKTGDRVHVSQKTGTSGVLLSDQQ